jgi:hypothetical protein
MQGPLSGTGIKIYEKISISYENVSYIFMAVPHTACKKAETCSTLHTKKDTV